MNIKPLLVFLALTSLACGGIGQFVKDVPLEPVEVKATIDPVDPDESANRLPVQADMANPEGEDTDEAVNEENGEEDAGGEDDGGEDDGGEDDGGEDDGGED
ncbi:MAG: hypothetical protein HN348_17660, partial [Proteobacteria bacterium]|nr:hypothetical protein [Pseudomonadota bacterium]